MSEAIGPVNHEGRRRSTFLEIAVRRPSAAPTPKKPRA